MDSGTGIMIRINTYCESLRLNGQNTLEQKEKKKSHQLQGLLKFRLNHHSS